MGTEWDKEVVGKVGPQKSRNPSLLSGVLGTGLPGLGTLEAAQGAPRDPRRDSRGERSPWLPLEPEVRREGREPLPDHAGESP